MLDRIVPRFAPYGPLRHAAALLPGMVSGLDRKDCWPTIAAGLRKARWPTLRMRIINVPARVASTARRLVLHLPDSWPWHPGSAPNVFGGHAEGPGFVG